MIKNRKKQLKRQTRNSGTDKNIEKPPKCTDFSSEFIISLRFQIFEGKAIILHYWRIFVFSAEIYQFRKNKGLKKIFAYKTT